MSDPGTVSIPPTLTDAELRRAPSPSALAALCAAVEPGGRVRSVTRLRGGISSGMHAVELVGSGGERRQVVVRRYGAGTLWHDPRVAEREWAVLVALARRDAPTPRPIWRDDIGAVFGCPTIVTSRLPGRGHLAPRDLAGWDRQLAEALVQIHATPLGEIEPGLLLDQRPELAHLLERAAPPAELAWHPAGPEVWSAMRRWWPAVVPAGDAPVAALVHGDFWPGNTLWRYGRLTGVIDWEQPRRGNPVQDVASCRLDHALLFGDEAPAMFLRAYEAASGRTVRQLFFWDLYQVTWALGGLTKWVSGYHDLGRTDLAVEVARTRLERFTADALARAAAS